MDVSNVIQADCSRYIAGVEVDRLFNDHWALAQAEEAFRNFDRQAGGKAVFIL